MTRTNFPHCVGAIDGKQVRVVKPGHSGSLFYNYKNYFSVVLLAVCDSNYKFLYIDVGSFGKESDSTVLNYSTFGRKLQEGKLNLPPPAKVSDNLIPLPYVFIGDEAFGISTNLMRACPGSNLTVPKRIFNYRLCSARRYVEWSFGILSNKWRIFHRPLNIDVKVAISLIKACCALHNFVRDRDGVRFEDTLDVTGLNEISVEEGGDDDEQPRPRARGSKMAYKYRDVFAQYFSSQKGAIPWQNSYI
nr:unnamed protein product [Callosobruchus chinensis]